MPLSIAEFARALQTTAGDIVARRVSDSSLYAVLAGCMEICERCRDAAEEAELRRLCAALPPLPGRNRTYVERGSDIYQAVARFVFHGEKKSANMNRYAHSLRQAALLQIRSSDLAAWLATEGGINALYLRRPLTRTTVSTKCLRLSESITVPKDKPFTLTLRRSPENVYIVMET